MKIPNDQTKLNDVLAHIQPKVQELLRTCMHKAVAEGLDSATLLGFLMMQGYLNGAIDTYVAVKGESNDLDRRIFGNKLVELLEPLRLSLEAQIRSFQAKVAKSQHRSN